MCNITDISMSLISFKKYNNIDINKIKKDDNIQIGIEKSENRKVQLFWTKVDHVISKDEIIVNINDNNIVIKLENIYYYQDQNEIDRQKIIIDNIIKYSFGFENLKNFNNIKSSQIKSGYIIEIMTQEGEVIELITILNTNTKCFALLKDDYDKLIYYKSDNSFKFDFREELFKNKGEFIFNFDHNNIRNIKDKILFDREIIEYFYI